MTDQSGKWKKRGSEQVYRLESRKTLKSVQIEMFMGIGKGKREKEEEKEKEKQNENENENGDELRLVYRLRFVLCAMFSALS